MNIKQAILLHDFSYSDSNENGKHINLKKGDILLLLERINEKWWRSTRIPTIENQTQVENNSNSSSDNIFFLVPSSHIQLITNDNYRSTLDLVERPSNDIEITMADYERESDDAFGSSHESSDGMIEDDNKRDCDIEEDIPIIKPRRFRKQQPLYANIPQLKENILNGLNESEKYKKSSPPLVSKSDFEHKWKRRLFDNWYEFYDGEGRLFYYNVYDNVSSWKPPRRQTSTKIDAIDVKTAQTRLASNVTMAMDKDHYDSDSEIFLSNRVKKIVQNFNDDDLLLSNLTRNSSMNKSKFKRIKPSDPLLMINNVQKQHQEQENITENPLLIISNLLTICPPEEWQRLKDPHTDEFYFICTGGISKKWFCAKDENGRIYFYENQRPGSSKSTKKTREFVNETLRNEEIPNDELNFFNEDNEHQKQYSNDQTQNRLVNYEERNLKAHSLAMISHPPNDSLQDIQFQGLIKHAQPFQDYGGFVPPPPSNLEQSDIILHDSLIQARTLISGKNKKKHWTTSYVVLTGHYMFFFKDQKNMFSPSKSDFVIGLLNAKVEWCSNESSRKNCFKVITFQNQTLLQDDDKEKSKRWVENIDSCIKKLTPIENIPINDGNIELNFRRSRSTKYHRPLGQNFSLQGTSTMPLGNHGKFSHSSPTSDKKKKIRERLLNFLKKRPPVESLREKGIIKDENLFGCTLQLICQREKSQIPRFVKECIQAIENNDITADGIYRACGNLSTVQKLRFEINQENYDGLWKEQDVHVLTGLLKMFFREMKEPLFPYDCFESLINLITIENRETKIQSFKSLIKNLPQNNYHTLKFVLRHLLKVTSYSKQNRMHIQNLAIVFGPTLIRKMNDLNNLVFDMMLQVQQSQCIEFLLQEYYSIFEF